MVSMVVVPVIQLGGCSSNSVGWLVQKGGLGGGFCFFFQSSGVSMV